MNELDDLYNRARISADREEFVDAFRLFQYVYMMDSSYTGAGLWVAEAMLSGTGCEVDYAAAKEMLKILSMMDVGRAQYLLACMVAKGHASSDDVGSVFELGRRSANNGCSDGALLVALLLAKDDFEKGRPWFVRAAELGSDKAVRYLAARPVSEGRCLERMKKWVVKGIDSFRGWALVRRQNRER